MRDRSRCVGVGLILVGCAVAGLAASAVEVLQVPNQVGQFERWEATIRWNGRYGNPFDPQEVDVRLNLTAPDGSTRVVPGFYMQPFLYRPAAEGSRKGWCCPDGEAIWKIRFAPSQTGPWTGRIVVKDRAGAHRSADVNFECTPSDRPGFIRIHQDDPRFFQHANGDFFFAIGQNLAFVGENQYVTPENFDSIVGKLADNGVNFLRIWTCSEDWALAVEARKSAWTRSWNRQSALQVCPTEGPAHDRPCVRFEADQKRSVEPVHAVAVKPATDYKLAGRFFCAAPAALRIRLGSQAWDIPAGNADSRWIDFDIPLTTASDARWLDRLTLENTSDETDLWLDQLTLTETEGGPNLLWEADIHRPARGYYNQIDCFWLDRMIDSAKRHNVRLMLCLITRDLYMASLRKTDSPEYRQAVVDAKNLLRYAVARWGASPAVAAWEYFNEIDPGLPTDAFYQALARYMDETDPYNHLLTTSTWHPSARDCRLDALDIAQLHHYMQPRSGEGFRDEAAVVLEKAKFLRDNAPAKPALIGEFGLATDKWALSEYMKQDARGVHFHNALWASALSGVSGTAMFWWWDQIDRQNLQTTYRPLAAFLKDESFAHTEPAQTTADDGRLTIIGRQSPERAILWIRDAKANWYEQVVAGTSPKTTQSRFTVAGLPPGRYAVQWWDTRTGRVSDDEHASTNEQGLLELHTPEFPADIACKIDRTPTRSTTPAN